LQLARADGCAQRFYSMSAQIRQERSTYYKQLERTQKDGLNITDWLEWFLECIDRALCSTENILTDILKKARFWETYNTTSFNERQRLILNKLFDDFFGKLTTSKWAKINKCSQDTALRDIQELMHLGILIKDPSAGRSTSYSLHESFR
jgi:Fic family protein